MIFWPCRVSPEQKLNGVEEPVDECIDFTVDVGENLASLQDI